ncbi:CPBP family intramembrane glutamic endopeptidase [Marisediminicola sp. LYQ134]|uniref:CPBP family intramembrane glutamic endopeptidase n=1 Tax=Marisediminicola sp. LYQ134 TaxID=3391061 RepID=UPI003982F088
MATGLEIAVYGGAATGAVQLGGPITPDRLTLWLVVAVLAPLLYAPMIEELFFRGLVVRSIAGGVDNPIPVGVAALAIAASSVGFALIHLIGVTSVTTIMVLGGSTLVFGFASGLLAILTKRLGASITAHVTFNALVTVPMLLA